jgi:PAS domain S-box-containing protein
MTIGLRTRLLLPLGVFVVALAAYLLAMGDAARLAPEWMLGLLLLLLATMATNVEVAVLRPLRRLLGLAQDPLPRHAPTAPVHAPSGPLRELAAELDRLHGRLQDYEGRLANERERRQALEHSVRELEDRYALTVERANDGLWEWNLKSGAIDVSPRWRGMLGWSAAALAGIDDWRALLHPDERDAVLQAQQQYLDGAAPRFDAQYRVRQGDGEYRWVHSRAAAIRHASGTPYRMIVMDNDIHARKLIETALIEAAEGLSAASGTNFFQALMRSLASILGTRDNLVCYCVGDPPTRARTLAYYTRGEFTENFEYELAGTSCGAVIERGEIVYCPTGVCELWPAEKQYDRDSYIGVPMFDSTGKIIGHFACMGGTPMRQDLPHLALFRIFSVRAAAELERTLLRQQLDGPRDAA